MNCTPLSCQKLTLQVCGKILCQPLELTIQSGEHWAILGKNGAGKSTLLHTLAGLHTPHSGEVYLYEQAISSISRHQIAQQLGVLLQEQSSDFPGTVWEHVMMGRHPHIGRWQWACKQDIIIAKNALKRLNLQGFEQRQITTLSGGERQRLAIATLLCQQPPLLLLDEPTNHLDLHQQIATLETLLSQKTKSETTSIMVMHDINLALRYCSHFLLLFDNGEHTSGTANAIINEQQLSRLYQHPIIKLEGANHPVFLPR